MTLFQKIKRAIPIAKRLLREKLAAEISYALLDKTTRKNVFKRKYDKHVLMVTLPAAFNKHLPKFHTSLLEALEAAKAFDELGYVVDCTTDNNTRIDLHKYDIIYCGRRVQAEVWRQNIPAKTIFFSPGAHPFFCFEATVQKNLAVKRDKGIWLTTSSRYLNELLLGYYVDNFADHVIVYGNQFVLDNYLKHDSRTERYSRLPAFYFDCHQPDLQHKDYSTARNGICWFGSLGLIHKGLDICIDIALAHPEVQLHICGATVREREFWNYYRPKIQGRSNIIDHGFVNIETEEFVQIMNQCAFVLHPSISEGGAPSVLNVVANAGLIPVVSKACGVDLPTDSAYVLDEISTAAFEETLLAAMKLSEEELRSRSAAVYEYVRANYTFAAFQQNIRSIIKRCVES